MQKVDGISLYQNHIVPDGQSSQAAEAGGAADISRELMQPGKGTVFEGVVTEVKDGYVNLSLDNGQTIRARLEAGVNIQLGEPLLFEVKANQDGQITLKQIPVQSQYNPTLQKALTAAGLPLTERNLNMVNTMMTKQMPIDKGSLTAMARLVQNFSQASVETLVQMKKLGFAINAASVQQFEAYKAGEHSLVNRFSQIIEQLPELVEQLSQQPGTSQAKAEAAENGSGRQLLTNWHELLSTLELLKEQPPAGDQTELVGTAEGKQAELAGTAEGKQAELAGTAEGKQAAAGTMVREQAPAELEATGTMVREQAPAEQEAAGTMVREQAADTKTAVSAPADSLGAGTAEGMETTALEQQLRQIPGMEENSLLFSEGKLNRSLGAGELLQAIQQQLEKLPDGNTKAVKDLFQGKGYKALFRQALEEQWLLEPRQAEAKENVERLYERLNRQLESLEQLLQNTGKEAQTLNKNVSLARGNLEMMNQINQLYNYVQLPLKLHNQNAHSDLYVYTNKKRLQDKDGELSALLHLELEHLGTTDVRIKMLKNNVTTDFYLSDDASLKLVEAHVGQLKERLEEKGYHCSIRLEKGEQKVDVVEDFLERELPLGKLQRYSFDVLT